MQVIFCVRVVVLGFSCCCVVLSFEVIEYTVFKMLNLGCQIHSGHHIGGYDFQAQGESQQKRGGNANLLLKKRNYLSNRSYCLRILPRCNVPQNVQDVLNE
jgi:hypothetical protein